MSAITLTFRVQRLVGQEVYNPDYPDKRDEDAMENLYPFHKYIRGQGQAVKLKGSRVYFLLARNGFNP